MSDPFDALRRDISDLGHILGETLVEQESQALLDLEEVIRDLAKERRRKNARKAQRGPATASMLKAIADLDANQAELVARAFTHYFQLVNLAEQYHRTRRRRDYAREGNAQPGSLLTELERLAAAGLGRERFIELLAKTRVELVFTAHPSEAQRRTVLDKHRRIVKLLARRERLELVPEERAEIERALREEVTTLWQTDEIRSEKPRVGDEVKNTLFYLEEVLFPLVPRFYAALEAATSEAFGEGIAVPDILHFGSWVGADMDGNPNVTPEVALDTAFAQAARVLRLYVREVDALGATLSQSTRRTRISEELEGSIARDAAVMPELAEEIESVTRGEPYRKKMRFIRARIEARHATLLAGRRSGSAALPLAQTPTYAGPEELLADLDVVIRSLEENRGQRAGLRQVRAFRRQVTTFGFHLAKLDVRIPAAWVRDAVAMPPEGRRSSDGYKAIEAIANIRQVTSGRGAEAFILSMSHGDEDMRASLALARQAGLYVPEQDVAAVSIVPLFETLDDLQRAPQEIEKAAADAEYRRYLDLRGGRQEIMIGYSDSNKDAGILASSFGLYRAQQKLVDVAKKRNLSLTIFHGRGGSIGRGGGPSQRAIESLPKGSVDGRFKLTEQGEVVGWKYLIDEIAERNLELTAAGVLRASVPAHTTSEDAGDAQGDELVAFEAAFDEVAEDSLHAYRALVHDPGFIRYYEESTPLEEIALLNIGSRPARRNPGAERKLEDLRAIPWVFAWTQSRQMVPGWFGAGRALQRLVVARGLPFVRRMREAWPFFASTLDAVAVSLATSDMDIASHYASLVRDRTLSARLFARIALDHGRAVRAITAIFDQPTILAHQPTLARSIALRNPYVDPLSFIQIELLRRKRAGKSDLDRAVLLTINGIASGLRNTG